MKQAGGLALVILATALVVSAQSLTDEDRAFGVKHLEQTRDEIVKVTEELSEAQWHFKPAPERWSVAECLEHIAVVEDFLFDMVTEKVMSAPAEPVDAAAAKEGDKLVLARLPDRSQRFQAPEPVQPSGRWASPQETLQHFLESRSRAIEYLEETPELREHRSDSPLGKLDAYQWLLYISAHSERHTKQMKEVMADASFPQE